VRDKSVALAIKVGKTGGKLTADLLKWAMRKYMTQAKNPEIHHGKQTVKQLVKQGQGVQNIEINLLFSAILIEALYLLGFPIFSYGTALKGRRFFGNAVRPSPPGII